MCISPDPITAEGYEMMKFVRAAGVVVNATASVRSFVPLFPLLSTELVLLETGNRPEPVPFSRCVLDRRFPV